MAVRRTLGPWERAAAHRRRFDIPVVGITGSSGKTTTKDMLAAILVRQGPILKSPGNMNMPGPVRRTLLRLCREQWAAVLELASARRGYVALSSWMARPTIGIITNIGLAHAILLGGPDGVAREKGALVRALPKGGLALLNHDDPGTRRLDLRRVKARILRYGLTPEADIWASDVHPERDGTAFVAHYGDEKLSLWIPAPGEHNVTNALAAFAAARHLGIPPEAIQRGLAGFRRMGSRMQFNRAAPGFLLIHDAYNANPLSMEAALKVLRQTNEGRRVAVLGRMGSLGRYTTSAHVQLGQDLALGGIDEVVLVGPEARNVLRGLREAGAGKHAKSGGDDAPMKVKVVATPGAAVDYLLHSLKPPAVVLFKASNNARLGDAYRQVAASLARRTGARPSPPGTPPATPW